MLTLPNPEDVPMADLICPPVVFQANNGKKGTIYIWKRRERVKGEVQDRYYWWALGGSGYEDNVPDAMSSARDWIRDSHISFR
jgi:hypothetical protein